MYLSISLSSSMPFKQMKTHICLFSTEELCVGISKFIMLLTWPLRALSDLMEADNDAVCGSQDMRCGETASCCVGHPPEPGPPLCWKPSLESCELPSWVEHRRASWDDVTHRDHHPTPAQASYRLALLSHQISHRWNTEMDNGPLDAPWASHKHWFDIGNSSLNAHLSRRRSMAKADLRGTASQEAHLVLLAIQAPNTWGVLPHFTNGLQHL